MTEAGWAAFSTGWLTAVIAVMVAILQLRRNGRRPRETWDGKERRGSSDCAIGCPRGIDALLGRIQSELERLAARVDSIYQMLAERRD